MKHTTVFVVLHENVYGGCCEEHPEYSTTRVYGVYRKKKEAESVAKNLEHGDVYEADLR
jgi:hypothetical protein